MNTNDSNKNTDRLREFYLASLTTASKERYVRSAISLVNNDVGCFSSCAVTLARDYSQHLMTEAYAEAHRWSKQGVEGIDAHDLCERANKEIDYMIKKLNEVKEQNLRIAAESIKQELPDFCKR